MLHMMEQTVSCLNILLIIILSASTGDSIGTFYSQLNSGILSIIHENVNQIQLI